MRSCAIRWAGLLVMAAALLGREAFADPTPDGTIRYEGGDGTSIEKAVLITGGDDLAATSAEYAWLHVHVPGAKVTRQSMAIEHGPMTDKILDKLEVTLPDGSEATYFFDISRSFGKGG